MVYYAGIFGFPYNIQRVPVRKHETPVLVRDHHRDIGHIHNELESIQRGIMRRKTSFAHPLRQEDPLPS